MRWIEIAKEGQPKVTPDNPYPTHWVRVLCVPRPETGLQSDRVENSMIRRGELRHFGRDLTRPNWRAVETQEPLENDVWVVTHYLDGQLDELFGWPK
jgi:hypothetical protein